jgi:hypothetical protein
MVGAGVALDEQAVNKMADMQTIVRKDKKEDGWERVLFMGICLMITEGAPVDAPSHALLMLFTRCFRP